MIDSKKELLYILYDPSLSTEDKKVKLTELINRLTDERDYYRRRVELKLKEKEDDS